MTEDALAWLRLTLVPGVAYGDQMVLLERFRTAARIFEAGAEAWRRIVPEPVASALARGPERSLLDRSLEWLAAPGRRLVCFKDPAYPQPLLHTEAPPVVLYAKGRVELLNATAVAIVGSRNATTQGQRDAYAMAKALSSRNLCITSGMALGIDAAAHAGGLAAPGASLAVLGTGIDRVYPRSNAALAERLATEGCIVSEFPIGMPPLPGNFPRRNRLISGMSRGVLVVEATLESGSLITAHLAAHQGREVFAMPGSVHSTLSKGCHDLIREGARLVESADDVLEELGMQRTSPRPRAATRPGDDPFLRALGFAPASIDEIARATGMEAAAVAAELSLRELDGLVAALPGGRFQRLVNMP